MGDTATNRAITGRLQELVGPSRGGGTKELSDGIGVPVGTVDRYVKGDRTPPHDFLLKVADWYEVSLDWLYGRSEGGGVEEAEQKSPAWARRLDARMRFLERKVAELPTTAYADKVGTTAAAEVIAAVEQMLVADAKKPGSLVGRLAAELEGQLRQSGLLRGEEPDGGATGTPGSVGTGQRRSA